MATHSLQQTSTSRNVTLIQHIRNHPVITFVILAFTLSWLVWGAYAYFPSKQQIVQTWAERTGTFGPALAAMILASLLNPVPTRVRPFIWWGTFLGAALFGWGYFFWKGDIKYAPSFPFAAHALSTIVIVIWGLMIAGMVGHTEGIRRLMRRQIQWPGWRWVILAVAFPLVIEFAGIGLTNLTGGRVYPWLITGSWDKILPLILSVFIGVWIAGGGNEETGWRGFMQPYLQKRYSPLITGIIIGMVMGLWHFPLHFMGTYAGNDLYAGLNGLAYRIISNIVLGIAFMWLYNQSRGSLFLVILFHVTINTSAVFITSTTLTQVLMFIVILSLIPIGRMWKKLPPETVEDLL